MNIKHIFKDINFDNVIIEYFNKKVNLKYSTLVDNNIPDNSLKEVSKVYRKEQYQNNKN